MKTIVTSILLALCLAPMIHGQTNSAAGADASPASLNEGVVKPTGRNILNLDPAKLVARPDKVLVGLTPIQVITKLGQPKEVKFIATDSTEVKLWTWYYTYEWPKKPHWERWRILSIRFTKGKSKEAHWLPQT